MCSKQFVATSPLARIDAKQLVKIADFGLARDIYEKDYYAVEDKKRPMPLKWMAPECLDTFKFDSRSDVVSCTVGTD